MQSKNRILFWILFLSANFLFKLELCKLGVIVADPARDLATAYRIVEGVEYPLIGPILGGHLHVGPLFFYVLALPLWISKSILSVLCFISLTQVIGIVYCYFWGKLYFNEKTGQILTALMAIDILSNFTLSSVSNIDLIFPLGVAFNYHLSRAILVRESRHLLIANLLFILAIQFHPLFFIFFPFYLYAFLLPIQNRGRILKISILVLILVMAPWIFYQLRYGFPAFTEAVNFSKWEIIGAIPWLKTLKSIPELMMKQIFWNPYILWGLSQSISFPLKYVAVLLLLLISMLTLYGTVLGIIDWYKRKAKGFILIFSYILLLWFTVPFLRNFTAWYYFAPVQLMWMALASYGFVNLMKKMKLSHRWSFQKLLLVFFMVVIGFSHYQVFYSFRERGTFFAPRNITLSILDLRNPFEMGQKDSEFLSLGVLEQEKIAKWAAHASERGKFHGAILYELSISRNLFYNVSLLQKELGDEPRNGEYYVGILKRDLTTSSHQHNIVYQAGAMIIIETIPKLDYSTIKMSYVEQKDWFKEGFNDKEWTSLILPAYTVQNPIEYPPISKNRWKGETIFLRMNLSSNPEGQSIHLGVGFPSWDPFLMNEDIESIYLNGISIPISECHKTAYGWVIPINPDLKKRGKNLLGLKLKLNKWSDLDIFTW